MNPNTFPITLSDGAVRELRYTFRSLQNIKKITGKSILNDGIAGLDEDLMPVLIYEGLVDKKDITPDMIADLMDLQSLPYYAAAFGKAFGITPSDVTAPKNVQDQ